MPWTSADADRFKTGLSQKQKKRWAAFANGALESCIEKGGSEKECSDTAARIASSKFSENFNPVLPDRVLGELRRTVPSTRQISVRAGAPDEVCRVFQAGYNLEDGTHEASVKAGWDAVHKAGWFKNKERRWVKRRFADGEQCGTCDEKKQFEALVSECMTAGGQRTECEVGARSKLSKMAAESFQSKRETPPDPRDGHVHDAAFDEDGNGGTSEAGSPPHVHSVFGFKVQPYYLFDPSTAKEYVSVHPGTLAFAGATDLTVPVEATEPGESTVPSDAIEMEIFRAGTHNKMEFDEADLEEMAQNFHALKHELRPKLKMTHRENQEKLAGLASYGDVVDVFTRPGADGVKRLFAKVANVPDQVRSWIRERRFPERSIELYPEFKLGTEEDAKVHRNVLKAVALLGAEMPAVTGMVPIALAECVECQGTVCVKVFKDSAAQEPPEVPETLAQGFMVLDAALRQAAEGVM